MQTGFLIEFDTSRNRVVDWQERGSNAGLYFLRTAFGFDCRILDNDVLLVQKTYSIALRALAGLVAFTLWLPFTLVGLLLHYCSQSHANAYAVAQKILQQPKTQPAPPTVEVARAPEVVVALPVLTDEEWLEAVSDMSIDELGTYLDRFQQIGANQQTALLTEILERVEAPHEMYEPLTEKLLLTYAKMRDKELTLHLPLFIGSRCCTQSMVGTPELWFSIAKQIALSVGPEQEDLWEKWKVMWTKWKEHHAAKMKVEVEKLEELMRGVDNAEIPKIRTQIATIKQQGKQETQRMMLHLVQAIGEDAGKLTDCYLAVQEGMLVELLSVKQLAELTKGLEALFSKNKPQIWLKLMDLIATHLPSVSIPEKSARVAVMLETLQEKPLEWFLKNQHLEKELYAAYPWLLLDAMNKIILLHDEQNRDATIEKISSLTCLWRDQIEKIQGSESGISVFWWGELFLIHYPEQFSLLFDGILHAAQRSKMQQRAAKIAMRVTGFGQKLSMKVADVILAKTKAKDPFAKMKRYDKMRDDLGVLKKAQEDAVSLLTPSMILLVALGGVQKALEASEGMHRVRTGCMEYMSRLCKMSVLSADITSRQMFAGIAPAIRSPEVLDLVIDAAFCADTPFGISFLNSLEPGYPPNYNSPGKLGFAITPEEIQKRVNSRRPVLLKQLMELLPDVLLPELKPIVLDYYLNASR